MEINKIYCMDSREGLKMLDDNSIDCCVTSPPYWGLRDYGVDGQIGLEQTPEEYVEQMVNVFREVKRVLKKEGTLWLNLGDSYFAKPKSNYNGVASGLQAKNYGTGDTTLGYKQQADKFKSLLASGYKNKDLVGIPWRVAFALQADGWYLRSDIIWHKPNAMPESVKDRPTTAHEYIFLLSKSDRYFYDYEAIKEECSTKENRPAGVVRNREYNYVSKENLHPQAYLKPVKKQDGIGKRQYTGFNDRYKPLEYRNKRDVWTVNTKPFSEAHFATFPEKLIEPCILAGCPEGGTVLDPFMGAGTTAVVAWKHNRNYIGFELNPEYVLIATKRLADTVQQVSLI